MYEGRVIFQCRACGGRMMSLYALREACGDRNFVNMLWQTAQHGYSEPGPRCSFCEKQMRTVTLPLSGEGIELDLCCRCPMIWFDPHELERIPRPEPPEPSQADLPPEAREILAIRRMEREAQRLERVYAKSERVYADEPDAAWKYIPGFLGMPVELDGPTCKRPPYLTWGIAALCFVVYLLTFSDLNAVVRNWGFIPDQWMRHGGMTMITSLFLHGGLFHLIGNLYFLLVFGDNVEDEFGPLKYTVLLISSAASAMLLHALFDPRTNIPCVGASGFISGIIVCYAICFPQVRLSFLLASRNGFLAFSRRFGWWACPAWVACCFWIFLQILMAALSRSDSVAYLAHIGGLIPGILFGIHHRLRGTRDFLRYSRDSFSETDYRKDIQ